MLCNSGEYQRSLKVTIGFSLPTAPAGNVIVLRTPSAETLSIVFVPSFSTFELLEFFEGPSYPTPSPPRRRQRYYLPRSKRLRYCPRSPSHSPTMAGVITCGKLFFRAILVRGFRL